jgi:putative ABC transport system permease protein
MLRDLRLAVRSLLATPAATVFAILSLTLTIGANAATFSIVNGLLLRPLPVADPSRLVHLTDSVVREDTGETRVRAWSYPVWNEIRRRAQLWEAATAWSFIQFDLASGGETRFVTGLFADGDFFRTLGVTAAVGRTFSALDDQPGGGPDGPVAVISYKYWQRELAGAANAVGKSLRLNSVLFTIVGVTPPEFFGPEVGRSVDIVVPISTEPLLRGRDSQLDESAANFLTLMARVKAGQSIDAAAAAFRSVQAEIRQATVGQWSRDVAERYLTSPFTAVPAATGDSALRDAYERPLFVVAAIVAVVLLIGCVNIANLLVARATARRHELTVQLALGASRWSIARQRLVESLVLAAAGTVLGTLIASYGSAVLVRQLSTPANPVFLDVSVDRTVLAFIAAVSAITTLLFGTVPALRAARVDPSDALKDQSRTITGRRHARLPEALVVVQVALSLALVTAAALFGRSFTWLTTRDLGFEPERVLVVTINPERTGIEPSQRLSMYERVRSAVAAVPGVGDAALSHRTPVGGGGFTPAVEVVRLGSSKHPASRLLLPADGDVFGNLVSAGWFRTFGTPIISGRTIGDSHQRGAQRVAVVNETFARRFLDGVDVIGSIITVYPDTPRAQSAQIVGVVADAVYGSPRDVVPPTWYLPLAQFDVAGFPFSPIRLSVRAGNGSADGLAASVVRAVSSVNPRLAVTVRPLEDQLRASLTRQRLLAQLGGFFGAIGLLLAGVGLYGIAAHDVSSRRNEIGVRIALGAAPARVLRGILRRISVLIVIGAGTGAAISAWASRFVETLVFGFPADDPSTFIAAAIVLAVVGLLAAWFPARRAVLSSPVDALRLP